MQQFKKEVKKHVDLIIYSYPVSLSLCCLKPLMTGILNTVLACMYVHVQYWYSTVQPSP